MTSQNTCSICYDDVTKETGSTQLSCSHLYHPRCIAQWMISHPNCPCCRAEPTEYENMMNLTPSDTCIYEPPEIIRLNYRYQGIDTIMQAIELLHTINDNNESSNEISENNPTDISTNAIYIPNDINETVILYGS